MLWKQNRMVGDFAWCLLKPWKKTNSFSDTKVQSKVEEEYECMQINSTK